MTLYEGGWDHHTDVFKSLDAKLQLALATVALAALTLVGAARALMWMIGPFAEERSRVAIRDAAPEIHLEDDYVS